MKRHQTSKHKKQLRKEKRNRKDKQATRPQLIVDNLTEKWEQVKEKAMKDVVEAETISPARRAFQEP